MTYIALLRGINVGGHRVKMDHLRDLFSQLDLKNVRTYIQSGNVFFESNEKDEEKLATKIENHLEKSLGYEVPTFLRTIEEVDQMIASDPFKNVTLSDDKRFCVVFTNEPLSKDVTLPYLSDAKDVEVVGATEREIFLVWYIINGRPPKDASFRKMLPKKNTTRFMHTLVKMVEAAKQ